MLLTIDVGNTATGLAIFSKEKIVFKNRDLTPNTISQSFLTQLTGSNFLNLVTQIIKIKPTITLKPQS